jgi:hypothetical protein
MGEIVYAGGKQIGSNIERTPAIKARSTKLPDKTMESFRSYKAYRNDNERSFVHLIEPLFHLDFICHCNFCSHLLVDD